jgi:hypothetical protein
MIRLPRRSVTRYFIPLIDVMILLFCIFLLMPIFKESDPQNPDIVARRKLEQELRERTKERDLARELLEALQKKSPLPPQRLAIRVLEIDPKDGRLFSYDTGRPPQKKYLDSADAAQELIQRHQEEIRLRFPFGERPDPHYLVLLPRVDTAYPEGQQLREYESWFKGFSFSIDRPGVSHP